MKPIIPLLIAVCLTLGGCWTTSSEKDLYKAVIISQQINK